MEEKRLLNLMETILTQPERPDRTGVGTKSIFSPPQLSFSLRDHTFPLLTTRKMSLRWIFEELMWFLRGQTDVSILQRKGVHVWDGNTSRAFLDARGLSHYVEGDLGPSYSFQFRYAGAEYVDCHTDYTGQGFDQLQDVIRKLKYDPYSRKIMINLWSPKDASKMSLEPCAFCYQFYVHDEEGVKFLSCKLTQRSSDIGLAGGWNVASAALLTYMLAHVCGMKPHRLYWSIGDAHIYLNQLEQVHTQIQRIPRPFPKMYITRPVDDITAFEWDCFRLDGYEFYSAIKLPMNV